MGIRLKLFFGQFCESAQYLRSSLRFVWWMKDLPSKNGETRVGRTIRLIVLDSKFVDDNTCTYDRKEDLLQKYQERVERVSQQNRVMKICTDAGFLTTVEVGQYFMKEFSQFTEPVACREYTKKIIWPEGWIRGNTKMGPVLEVTTCCLQGKYGLEIRIESVNKDNSHSWVSISHGLNKLITDLSNKETTTTSRKPLRFSSKNLSWRRMYLLLRADQRLKQNNEDVLLLPRLQELYQSVKDFGLM